MKRHVIALTLGIVLLLISALTLSCVPKTVATAPTDGIAYKSDVTALQNAQAAQSLRIDNIAGKAGVSSADVQNAVNSSLSDYYTKAEVDQKIADAIKKHKDETATAIPTTTPSGTATTSGQYTITLDHNQIISMASETGNKDVSVTITNNGASAVPSLLISLRPLSPSTFETTKLQPHLPNYYRDMKSTLSGFADYQEGMVQTNPDADSLLQKLYWISPELALASGGSKTVWFNFQVRTDIVVTWVLEIKAL